MRLFHFVSCSDTCKMLSVSLKATTKIVQWSREPTTCLKHWKTFLCLLSIIILLIFIRILFASNDGRDRGWLKSRRSSFLICCELRSCKIAGRIVIGIFFIILSLCCGEIEQQLDDEIISWNWIGLCCVLA